MEAKEVSSSIPDKPPRRIRVFRALALGLSLVTGLLAAEIGLRGAGYSPAYVNAMGSFHLGNEISGHRGKPNFRSRFKTPEFDVLIVHDAAGFRRQEFQVPESSAKHRLFVFGDSFVWGWGVQQGEVFTDQISRHMPRWHVENLGINGTGTVAQYALFASECRQRLSRGDTVLLSFFGNDFRENLEGTRRAVFVDGQVVMLPVAAPLESGWKGTLQESSYLFNYFSYVVNRWQLQRRVRRAERQAEELAAESAARHTRQVVRSAPSAAPAEPSQQPQPLAQGEPSTATAEPPLTGDAAAQIAVARHVLAQWKNDCQERHARFLVAYVPGASELEPGDASVVPAHETAHRRAFMSCADDLGIETIDLLPAMLAAKRAAGSDHLVIPRDGHWTAAGHQIVADIIAARLADASTAHR